MAKTCRPSLTASCLWSSFPKSPIVNALCDGSSVMSMLMAPPVPGARYSKWSQSRAVKVPAVALVSPSR